MANLIDDTIRDGNKITVLTALPRGIAIKALKKANLSPLFQGRIDPENLVSPLHLTDFKTISTAAAAGSVQGQNAQMKSNNEALKTQRATGVPGLEERNSSKSVSSLGDREGLRFDGAAVIKCCGLMRKPGGATNSSLLPLPFHHLLHSHILNIYLFSTVPLMLPYFTSLLRSSLFAVVSVFISANRRNVLSAKRMGLTVVGIQGSLDGVSCDCFLIYLSVAVHCCQFSHVLHRT